MFDKRDLNYAINLLDMALMQRNKDRSLVRKILIDRANANPATSATRLVVTAPKPSRFSTLTTASSIASTV